MFGSKALERALSALVAENTDLRRSLNDERQRWAEERQQLLDRLIACTNPAATRELKRQPTTTPPSTPAVQVQTTDNRPRRINFPGYSNSTPLPPYPKLAVVDAPSEAN